MAAPILLGKVALVTGSTSGIGKAICESFAQQGCDIILNGFGDANEIEQLRKSIHETYSVKVNFVGADLSVSAEIHTLQKAILELYPLGIDILVNNAGIQHVSAVEDFPEEKWNFMMSLMVTAPFLLTKLFLPFMRKKGWGRIINMSSAHGHVASANKSAYISAKHGIIGFTKAVALETAGSGVTCNAICPGYVDTPLFVKQAKERAQQQGVDYEEAKRQIVDVHASKEPVKVEQIGQIAVFLCSSAADQMMGTSMVVDGGWTAH